MGWLESAFTWMWESIRDPSSPFGVNKEFYINVVTAIFTGVLSAVLIAPMTAWWVQKRQQKEWSEARRHFLNKVRAYLLLIVDRQHSWHENWSKVFDAYDQSETRKFFTDSDSKSIKMAFSELAQEFDIAGPILSPRSHSLFARIRREIERYRKDMESELDRYPDENEVRRKMPAYAEARERAQALGVDDRFLLRHFKSWHHLDMTIENYFTPMFDTEVVFEGLWRIAKVDNLQPSCKKDELLDRNKLFFSDIPDPTWGGASVFSPFSRAFEQFRKLSADKGMIPRSFDQLCKLFTGLMIADANTSEFKRLRDQIDEDDIDDNELIIWDYEKYAKYLRKEPITS